MWFCDRTRDLRGAGTLISEQKSFRPVAAELRALASSLNQLFVFTWGEWTFMVQVGIS